jgi:hypothetical protein
MNSRKLLASLTLFSVYLASCSGKQNNPPCTVNCGGGTATLSLTLIASPLTPPPGTNLLAFRADINTVTLTPTTGAAVNMSLKAASLSVDLTRLQSDSALLGTSIAIPAATYSSISLSLSNPVVTYCAQTQGNAGCAPGSVATLSGATSAPIISTAPFPLTLSANQTTGLAINVDLSKTITVNASQVITALTLGTAGTFTASALPPAVSNVSAGQLDFIEDVTGIVTALDSITQLLTIKTATHGSFTAAANSSTVFSPNCTAFNFSLNFSSCVLLGQVASVDLVLNSDGTFAILEYDPLAIVPGDWIEGVVTSIPASSTQFAVVTNDFVSSTSASLISGKLGLGAPVDVTLAALKPFLVDSKGLTVPVNNFTGTDASILIPGQTVFMHITGFTATAGSTPAGATVDSLYLRFTRVSGTVAATGTQASFNIQSLPSFFGLTTQSLVELTQGTPSTTPATNFEGVTSGTGLSSPQTVSIRALYFGTGTQMPFSAAKVRVP